jgi:hypothetical protein
MKAIYKYPIKDERAQTIRMPEGAEILSVQCQGEQLCIWAMVDTESPSEHRRFVLLCTGEPCEELEHGRYVGTVQLRQGVVVLHLFDLGQTNVVGEDPASSGTRH